MEVQDILFNCLRDIIYAPENAQLDLSMLPEDYQKLGAGLNFLANCVKEQKLFAKSLIKGDFESNIPTVENGIAAPLKEVHAILKHVLWQTKRVAQGDYKQHLDHFGEFSDAFNEMVHQLEERQEKLETERNQLQHKNAELMNLQELFKAITVNAPDRIIAVKAGTGEITYLNHMAAQTKEKNPKLFQHLHMLIQSQKENCETFCVDDAEIVPGTYYYRISRSTVENAEGISCLFVISDVTNDRKESCDLERMAYLDELTLLPNRRYGMGYIETLKAKNEEFSIGYIDIDHLKYCNDTYGHEMGDEYILEVTETLKQLGNQITVCRIGGDEFLVIQLGRICSVSGKTLDEGLTELREEYKTKNTKPFEKSFSFGVEFRSKDDQRGISQIMRSADEKMYQYKFAHKRKLDYADNR